LSYPPRQLIRAIEQAERLQIFDLNAIRRLEGRQGITSLRTAIAAVTGEPPRTNSNWERDLLDFCDDNGRRRVVERGALRRVGAKTEHGKEAGVKACSARRTPMTQPGDDLQPYAP
jgi:hypothetical protein